MTAFAVASATLARLDYLLQFDGGSQSEVVRLEGEPRAFVEELHSFLDLVITVFKSNTKPLEDGEDQSQRLIQFAYDAENFAEFHALPKNVNSSSSGSGSGSTWRSRLNWRSKPLTGTTASGIGHELAQVSDIWNTLEKFTIEYHEKKEKAASSTAGSAQASSSQYHGHKISGNMPQRSRGTIGLSKCVTELKDLVFKGPRQPTAIIGSFQSGKTTLARKFFLECDEGSLNYRIWVTVSKDFKLRDFLETIAYGIHPDYEKDQIKQLETTTLTTLFHEFAKQRRGLIILDDVWSTDVWEILRHYFPEDHGASFLITTRDQRVANHLKGHVYQVPQLSEKESRKLFLKRLGNDYPISGKAEEILDRCNGLPLAIVVAAKVYVEKKDTPGKKDEKWENWDNILECMNKDTSILNVVSPIYDCLPLLQKPCVLYLGLFPSAQQIPIEKLYLMWMAEGLVSSRDEAESYFSNLVDRNLVVVLDEVVTAATKGVGRCQPHDLVRGLCYSKGKEGQYFDIVDLSYESEINHRSNSSVHRVALCLDSQKLEEFDISRHISQPKHIRSLLISGTDDPPRRSVGRNIGADFKAFKWTRMLDFDSIDFRGGKLPKGIEELIYLRYLGFRECYLEELPSSCCNFPFLETLYLRVRSSCNVKISNDIRKLKNLRNIYFPSLYHAHSAEKKLELEDLERLEILENFDPRVCDIKDLEKLKNLKNFTVTADGNYIADLKGLIDQLVKGHQDLRMSSLILFNFDCYYSSRRLEVLGKVLCLNDLLVLHVEGQVKEIPRDLTISQIKLTKLVLDGCELGEDPMQALGELEHLVHLVLCNNAIDVVQITCLDSSFKQLMSLKLTNLESLKKWIVEKEAMPKLSYLIIERCYRLQMLPDQLLEIPSLRHLGIGSMPKEFQENVAKIRDGKITNMSHQNAPHPAPARVDKTCSRRSKLRVKPVMWLKNGLGRRF